MTFTDFVEAGHNLSEMWSWLSGWHGEILSGSVLSSAWSKITGIVPAIAIGVIFLLLSLVQTFFGKYLLKVEKIAFFAYIGFILGEYFLVGIFPLRVFGWVFGILCGVTLAIMSRELYYIVYAFIVGYAAYTVLYGGYYLPESLLEVTKGNFEISLAGALVVIALALLLHKLVDLALTSVLGAWCVVLSLNFILNTIFGAILKSSLELIIFAIVAVAGIIVQKFILTEDVEFNY